MTGSGTVSDPYIISDVDDLQAIENDLTAYYELGGNIDASATSGWNGNAGFAPITIFTGQLDGKDYTISDLFINRSASYLGLFGQLDDSANIQNVKMTGVDITSITLSRVGSLVGRIIAGRTCTVTNCSTTGAVEASHADFGQYVGGLIGYLGSGTITSCWSSCTVVAGEDNAGGLIGFMEAGIISQCYATGAVSVGDDYGGGFVGWVSAGNIDDCYATGNVTVSVDSASGRYAGGFVGANEAGVIDDCYSIGVPAGDTSIGGFCGDNIAGTITNCFWDKTTAGTETSDGGTGKTTAEMKTKATFTDAGWNFTTIWYIQVGNYPSLSGGTTVFPTDAITRVTGLVHRYDRYNPRGYTLELLLGDTKTAWVSSVTRRTPKSSSDLEAEAEEKSIDELKEAVKKSGVTPTAAELVNMEERLREEVRSEMRPRPPMRGLEGASAQEIMAIMERGELPPSVSGIIPEREEPRGLSERAKVLIERIRGRGAPSTEGLPGRTPPRTGFSPLQTGDSPAVKAPPRKTKPGGLRKPK